MNVLPLCTSNFWPTNSGTIVQARLQVFSGMFEAAARLRCTFSNSTSSTYGPFFKLRDIRTQSTEWPIGNGQFKKRLPALLNWPLAIGHCLFPSPQAHLPVSHRPAPPQDAFSRILARIARAAALGELAPRRARVSTAVGATFAAAPWVVVRVHGL